MEKSENYIINSKINPDVPVGVILQNLLEKINSLTIEVNELKTRNLPVQGVVSLDSPLYELWDNEVDDEWNNF